MISLALISGCLSTDVDPLLIDAIVHHESAYRSTAINVNGRDEPAPVSEDPTLMAEASTLFIEAGYTVDVGLMGINSENLRRFDVPVMDAFDQCTNIALGERVLQEGLRAAASEGASGAQQQRIALSYYNTGSATFGFSNGYVERVWGTYQKKRVEAAHRSPMSVQWNPAMPETGEMVPSWSAAPDDRVSFERDTRWEMGNE